MNALSIAENIIRFRREKKITQEQLADYVGVTKASVSKWETKQSMPDILLLPRLASFFDVTIDELLGYEPQLSREQIQKIYLELAEAFAKEPFEEVVARAGRIEKEYYNCYSFLYQLVLLYLNHFMLADNPQRQQELLEHALQVCDHILGLCKEISICNKTVVMRAMILLQLGKAAEVIETLEEIMNPISETRQSAALLVQAYQMTGELDKADSFSQLNMYHEVINLIGWATEYLSIHGGDIDVCEETIRRVSIVAEAYDLLHLNANSIALFWYQAAILYAEQGDNENALNYLKRFGKAIEILLTGEEIIIHGDSYFTKLEQWLQEQELGGNAPRDKKVIWDSAIHAFSHPAFASLEREKAFVTLKERIIQKRREEIGGE